MLHCLHQKLKWGVIVVEVGSPVLEGGEGDSGNDWWVEEGLLVGFCLFISVCMSGLFDRVKVNS